MNEQDLKSLMEAYRIVYDKMAEFGRPQPHIIWAKLFRIKTYLEGQINATGEEIYSEVLQ